MAAVAVHPTEVLSETKTDFSVLFIGSSDCFWRIRVKEYLHKALSLPSAIVLDKSRLAAG